MRKKPYSIWKRKLPSGRVSYYARFRLDDGSWSVAKASGQRTKTAAEAWAIDYLARGQVITKENITFKDFTKDYFAWDGPYIKSLLLRGKQIGQRHAANQQAYLENYLVKEFGELKPKQIDADRIQEYAVELRAQGLSASTVNHILNTLQIVLQGALRKKVIQALPEISTVGGVRTERGVLTLEEVKKFFAQSWKDERYLAINLIAATTGMRLGEILGLTRDAVKDGYLEVKASWERGKGLKGTKSGRPRLLPLVAKTKASLARVMETTTFTEPSDFVFPGRKRKAPLDHKIVQKRFSEALAGIDITEEIRRDRGLSFHSWRHFFNSLLINQKVPLLKVQALTGHSTARMTEQYFHPDDYKDVLEITGGVI
ncbi:MAG: site-specific integrase [Rectinemataceae bacterium]